MDTKKINSTMSKMNVYMLIYTHLSRDSIASLIGGLESRGDTCYAFCTII